MLPTGQIDAYPAIRSVLAAYRSTDAHITEEQITAAWDEYEQLRELRRSLQCIADGEVDGVGDYSECVQLHAQATLDGGKR